MLGRVGTAVLALLLVAGCAGTAPKDSDESTAPGITIDSDRPDPTTGLVDPGVAAGPDLNATLQAPPRLIPGEWWRIKLHDSFSGSDYEFFRVVARADAEGYVFGMPHEGWQKEAVIYHSPAFGDVNLDLAHRAHDVPFLPLKFPLTDGATWDTHWESTGAPVKARVTVTEPTIAKVTFTGTACGIFGFVGQCPEPEETTVIELEYDAKQHEVVKFRQAPIFNWEVVAHGYGFEGWVTVPRAEHLVFFDGRIGASTVNLITQQPDEPTTLIKVEGGFNRVSFIIGAGNLEDHPGGAYEIKATAPDGKAYTAGSVPGAAFALKFLEHPNPDGDWTIAYTIAGPGYGFIEGIAYHQYDIRLPDGLARSDHDHAVVR